MVAAAVLTCCPVGASSLRVAPLQANLGPQQPTAQLEVHNDGASEAVLDVRIFSWTQVAGQDVLSATDEVAAVPPVFRVTAGKQQVVRVGLVNRTLKAPAERSYRLVLTEVPQGGGSPNTLRFQMRMLIPIFASTAEKLRSTLTMRLRQENQQLLLDATNSGNGHAKITAVILRDGRGRTLSTNSLVGYVLPGSSVSIRLPGKLPDVPISAADVVVMSAGASRPEQMPVEVR